MWAACWPVWWLAQSRRLLTGSDCAGGWVCSRSATKWTTLAWIPACWHPWPALCLCWIQCSAQGLVYLTTASDVLLHKRFCFSYYSVSANLFQFHLRFSSQLYCVEWTQYSIHPKRSAVCNRCFPGPTRVVEANDISIATAVFAGFTRWQTGWQTHRPRYSVGNNWRSAYWTSQILLLSTAARCFPGPTRVLDANGILIASAIFAGITRWQTDRPRYSVGNNRRSTQWRSQILLLSMATTTYNKYLLEQSTQIHNACLYFVSVHQMAPP